MKRYYLIASLALAGVMQSCNKLKDVTTKQITIDTTIAAAATYSLDLKAYGNAARITKQAESYSTSAIQPNTLVYTYTALAKSTASEQVVLGVANAKTGSNNCKGAADSTSVTVNISVK